MSRHTTFAIASFHAFLGLAIALDSASLPSAYVATELARLGIGGAVVLWWINDASQRRVAIPYMSLWVCVSFWFIVAPVHYLTTRGVRGLAKLGGHAALALLVIIGAAFGGEELRAWASARPTFTPKVSPM